MWHAQQQHFTFNFSMSPSPSLRVFEFLETQQFHDSNEFLRPAKPSTLPWLDFSMGSLPGMFCTADAWPAANAGAATAAGTAVEPSAATAAGAGPSSGIVTGPCSKLKLNGIWARNKIWDLCYYFCLSSPAWNGGGITPFAGGGGGGCAGGGGITLDVKEHWYSAASLRWMTGWQWWQLILSWFTHPSLFLELIPSNLAFKFSKLLLSCWNCWHGKRLGLHRHDVKVL